jgi:hypothetical protein
VVQDHARKLRDHVHVVSDPEQEVLEHAVIEYRTFPDTHTKVIGHSPPEGGSPADALSFEAFLPSGLVIAYGTGDSGKPLAPMLGGKVSQAGYSVSHGADPGKPSTPSGPQPTATPGTA